MFVLEFDIIHGEKPSGLQKNPEKENERRKRKWGPFFIPEGNDLDSYVALELYFRDEGNSSTVLKARV